MGGVSGPNHPSRGIFGPFIPFSYRKPPEFHRGAPKHPPWRASTCGIDFFPWSGGAVGSVGVPQLGLLGGLTRNRGRRDRRPRPQGWRPGRKAPPIRRSRPLFSPSRAGERLPSSPGTCASRPRSHRLVVFWRKRERYGFEDVTARGAAAGKQTTASNSAFGRGNMSGASKTAGSEAFGQAKAPATGPVGPAWSAGQARRRRRELAQPTRRGSRGMKGETGNTGATGAAGAQGARLGHRARKVTRAIRAPLV